MRNKMSRSEFLKKNDHLIPEIIKNMSDSFTKPWVNDYDKNNLYYQMETIQNYLETVLEENRKYRYPPSAHNKR